MSVDTGAEIRVLRTALRDLVALSAIPAVLAGREPAAVAAGLADVLIELLQLEFVFVRLRIPSAADAVDVMRGTAWKTLPAWLESHLAESGRFSGIEIIPDVDGGPGPCRGVAIPIGVNAEGGVVIAACGRVAAAARLCGAHDAAIGGGRASSRCGDGDRREALVRPQWRRTLASPPARPLSSGPDRGAGL